jgi:4'-phosphopantetheinyl transferase
MRPSDGKVEVWIVALDRGATAHADILDAEEHARAGRLRSPVERARFVAAHCACRHIIGAFVGAPPGDVVLTRTASGKPSIAHAPSLHFSMARSVDLAVVAIAAQPLGIDIERVRPNVWSASFAGAQFGREASGATDEELFRLWTRREALGKLVGDGLITAQRADGRGALFLDVPLPGGYVGTAAVTSPVCGMVTRVWRG